MDPARYERVTEIFLAISSLPATELAAALDRECAGDAELRAEVESLLAHRREESLFTDRTPVQAATVHPLGRHIGGILVQKRIAEGGMGTVYLGLDERLRRRVALKVLHSEWRLDPEARARFRREARVLSQLKHPAICEIHGYEETPDSDYLVLEYIDGRSLKKAVADGLPLAERDRIAATLAEVLQVAHSAGVVHRDLKPDNVMLTAAGQVKVLDFGIARVARRDATQASEDMSPGDSSRPGASAPGSTPPTLGESGSVKTRAGFLMGTPRYMSPEQARSEVATPASDIYALGLILYEMYTGESAYPRQLWGNELLERLRAGRIKPIRGMSRERRRLVERMLSFEPAARPTATEVAQGLQHLRERPRRRLRQALVAAGIVLSALAGAKYITDVQAERAHAEAARAQAEAARAQAEAARAQAERLVNFLLDDLYDELWARERREYVDRVSRETLRYFEELPEPLQRASAVRMARALRNQGTVLTQQGQFQAARAAYTRALELDEQAAATTPGGDLEALAGMGSDLQNLIGLILDIENDFETALTLVKRSLDVHTQLAQRQPGEVRWRDALALAWEFVGWSHYHQGDLAASLSGFEHAAELYRQLLALEPGHRARRFHLGDVLHMIGQAQYFLGQRDAALASYREGSQLLQALTAEDPTVFNYAGFAAEVDLSIGRSLAQKGDLSGALAAIEKARAVFERNHEQDPSRRRWSYRLLQAHLYAARVLRQRGDAQDAQARLERAAPATIAEDSGFEEQSFWAEVQLELHRPEKARPVVERLVAKGWHLTPAHAEFSELAQRHGFLPAAGAAPEP